jgi:hypothetical protein
MDQQIKHKVLLDDTKYPLSTSPVNFLHVHVTLIN